MEISPEVETWYASLKSKDKAMADRAFDRLAELVYTLRTRAGLTQTELARRMCTTQSSIARIEGGGSVP